jgi:hypothetical protein
VWPNLIHVGPWVAFGIDGRCVPLNGEKERRSRRTSQIPCFQRQDGPRPCPPRSCAARRVGKSLNPDLPRVTLWRRWLGTEHVPCYIQRGVR